MRLYPAWIKNDEEFFSLPVLERALQLAAARVGERETRRNSSRMIDQFLAAVRLGPGFAWCASFIYWTLINSGFPAEDLPPARSAAAVVEWVRWATRKGLLTIEPQRGDLMYWVNANGRTGHIGWIVRVEETRFGVRLHTIEGNTDDEGSREGDGVYRRTRMLGGRIKVISMTKLAASIEREAA